MDEIVGNDDCHNYTNGAASLLKRNLRSSECNEENLSTNPTTCSAAIENLFGNGDTHDGSVKPDTDTDDGIVNLLTLWEAPNHLRFNRNIHKGYRKCLTTSQCLDR